MSCFLLPVCARRYQCALPMQRRKWVAQGHCGVLPLQESILDGFNLTRGWRVKVEWFCRVRALVIWFFWGTWKWINPLFCWEHDGKQAIFLYREWMKELQQSLTYWLADFTNRCCCAGGGSGRFVSYCAGSIFSFWLLASSVHKCWENALGLSALL